MYGMRFAQIAQDMCNYLDAQTQGLSSNIRTDFPG